MTFRKFQKFDSVKKGRNWLKGVKKVIFTKRFWIWFSQNWKPIFKKRALVSVWMHQFWENLLTNCSVKKVTLLKHSRAHNRLRFLLQSWILFSKSRFLGLSPIESPNKQTRLGGYFNILVDSTGITEIFVLWFNSPVLLRSIWDKKIE